MKYQINSWVWCETGKRYIDDSYRCIIESEKDRNKISWQEVKEEKFLLIGYCESAGLPYLLLVQDPQIKAFILRTYKKYNFDCKYQQDEERGWAVAEDRILRVEPVISYGGKCRKCGDFNEYAEVDSNRMFLCYGCRK